MTTIKRKKNDANIFILLIYLFVFQELFSKIIPVFQYFDEFYAIIIFIVCIFIYRKKLINLIYKYYIEIILILLLIIVGFISSIINHCQPIKAVLIDFIIIIKFPLSIFTSMMLFDNFDIYKKKAKIKKHIIIITMILLIFTILNYIFNLFPSTVRYGIMSNQLFYSHPAKVVIVCTFLLIINCIVSNKRIDYIYYILFFLILSSLRFKGIGFAISSLLMLLLSRNNKKISFKVFLLIGLIAIIFSFNQIKVYYAKENVDSARNILQKNAIRIANDELPFGSGFATYGSYASEKYYSPVYVKYGMNKIWGFTKDNSSFICDSFWPMIIGEFGYFGLIIYIIFVIRIIYWIQKTNIYKTNTLYIAKLLCFVYLIISSTSETAFVNPLAVSLSLIFGLKEDSMNKQID